MSERVYVGYVPDERTGWPLAEVYREGADAVVVLELSSPALPLVTAELAVRVPLMLLAEPA